MADIVRTLVVGCCALFAAHTGLAQLNSQSLTWNTEAVAQRFVAAHGQGALISGYASDSLEVWAYPFQILSGYRIDFRPAGSTTAIHGQEILARVTYEPDSIVRTYLGPDFVVRETLFVPLKEAGAILTYRVESAHPVDIEVHAVPVLNLMWPAGLGGQSVQWDPALSAFVLAESSSGITAAVGSPEISAHDPIGNRTVRGVGDTGLGLTLHPDQAGVTRLYVALDQPHSAEPGSALRTLIRNHESHEVEFHNHVRQVEDSALHLETPDALVNRAFAWSELALDQAWVCNPDLGCGFVAGYGPSRGARRPQYDWFFAGDGLIAANAAMAAGDRQHAREELEFILRYQNKKNGMIWHELSQSAGYLDWAGKYPYMYVHVDISFQFLSALADYLRASGDTEFVRTHWPQIDAAYRYCTSVIDPVTGLPRIPADKEGGNEQDRMSDDLGLSVSWVAAAEGYARFAVLAGHAPQAAQAAAAAQRARSSIAGLSWSKDQSFWISGHSLSGSPMLERRSGPSEALALHLFTPAQEQILLNEIASSAFQTDWGSRGIGLGSPGFDPESYSKGSVSAVGTAFLATAFWTQNRPVTAFALWHSLLPWLSLDSLGHMHEVLAGNLYRAQVESVPEQTWSSAAFVDATVHGLLGLEIDASEHRVVFAPHLPADWTHITVGHVPLSPAELTFSMQRDLEQITLDIDNGGDPFQLQFSPELPLGASLGTSEIQGQAVSVALENLPDAGNPQETKARVSLHVLHGKTRFTLHIRGGVSVLSSEAKPLLGNVSEGMHVIDVHLHNHVLTIIADVPTQADSHLQLQSSWTVDTKHSSDQGLGELLPRQVSHPETQLVLFPAEAQNSKAYRRVTAQIQYLP